MRLIGGLLIISLTAGVAAQTASNEITSQKGKSRMMRSEILIQYRANATEEDKVRVRKKIGAALDEKIDSLGSNGSDSNLEVVSIEVPNNRLKGNPAAAAIRIAQRDPAVRFAELNGTIVQK